MHVALQPLPALQQVLRIARREQRVVQRIITDLAVIDVVPASRGGGLVLVETAPGVTREQVEDATEPPLG